MPTRILDSWALLRGWPTGLLPASLPTLAIAALLVAGCEWEFDGPDPCDDDDEESGQYCPDNSPPPVDIQAVTPAPGDTTSGVVFRVNNDP